MFKIRRFIWALRKLRVPAHGGLVLDVGSGGRPYPRSDVLLDRLTGYEHRCGEDMLIDGRAAVLGNAVKMPFKDKAFDFVIASHILEHIAQPETFIEELQRVGKAGYIETPNAIFERLYPHPIHCLEVVCIDGQIRLYKKRGAVEDSFLGAQRILKDDPKWAKFFYEAPDMFHVRYHWEGSIDYVVLNPEVSCEWIERINEESDFGAAKDSYIQEEHGWREIGQALLSRWYAFWRSRRLKDFNLVDILICPECHGVLREEKAATLSCVSCNRSFPLHPIPDFTADA